MKWKIMIFCTALAVVIGGAVFMNSGFAANQYSASANYPEPCVCSTPKDLKANSNHFNRAKRGVKSGLEPRFLMTLYHCKCGSLRCVVSPQAISCRK